MKAKSWFEVDKDGLKALQLGKPKSYIIRELVANAWDENITFCKIETAHKNGIATISVEDDNPEGFRDLTDSYTIFKHTIKRSNPKQRGRFNIGEKQVLAICRDAKVESTKGTITFNKDNTRSHSTLHRSKGTKVTVNIRMSKADYEEILDALKLYLSPKNIVTTINGQRLDYKQPFKTISATLQTELESNGIFRKTQRKTEIEIHQVIGDSYLYEMQIPVTKIDCQFSIDIQQKIPLSIDRETVSQAFLESVFAEVLNAIFNDIPEEKSSEKWIRQATSNERISNDAVKTIIQKRFGDKVVVANPNDPNANDTAISKGYRVIQGRELSGEEWQQFKDKAPISSTSSLFGTKGFALAQPITPTPEQIKVSEYAKKLHKRLNDIDLTVRFVKCSGSNESADYGNATLTFNLSHLPSDFFDNHLKTTDLILHELGHQFGNHTEYSYHQALTRMAQELIIIALEDPKFFD